MIYCSIINYMKILITGSKGFIGKNLIAFLKSKQEDIEILEFDIENTLEDLDSFCKQCDFVFNFAAVHRPKDQTEFYKTNTNQFELLLNMLKKHNNHCPVLYTSSIQSNNGTAYGESKYLAEELLFKHGEECGSRHIVYRLTNTFGRWAKPNSHSVVATFCFNVWNDIPLIVTDSKIVMHFVYIDDVIESFYQRLIEGKAPLQTDNNIYSIDKNKIIDIKLGELADLITSFKTLRDSNSLSKRDKLFYLTYLSYGKQ